MPSTAAATTAAAVAANPFTLMMNPASVLRAMERSDSLRRLNLRRVQPLDEAPAARGDKQGAAQAGAQALDAASFPLWRDLVYSSDPEFFPRLFS